MNQTEFTICRTLTKISRAINHAWHLLIVIASPVADKLNHQSFVNLISSALLDSKLDLSFDNFNMNGTKLLKPYDVEYE